MFISAKAARSLWERVKGFSDAFKVWKSKCDIAVTNARIWRSYVVADKFRKAAAAGLRDSSSSLQRSEFKPQNQWYIMNKNKN